VSDRTGPPTLSLVLNSALTAAVGDRARRGLLLAVSETDDAGHPGDPQATQDGTVRRLFPSPRRPTDDDPSAA